MTYYNWKDLINPLVLIDASYAWDVESQLTTSFYIAW